MTLGGVAAPGIARTNDGFQICQRIAGASVCRRCHNRPLPQKPASSAFRVAEVNGLAGPANFD
jgi:hypothetical protein